MWECETCDRVFGTWGSSAQHMDATDHWEETYNCETCDKEFYSQHAVEQHMNATGHRAPTYDHSTRINVFVNGNQVPQHMLQQAIGNFATVTNFADRYCSDCKRYFNDANALRQHRNSRIHRGANMACPWCQLAYVSASGLAHHLESGSCVSAPQVDRESLFRIIRERDVDGVLTRANIAYGPSTVIYDVNACYDYNRRAWVCYICQQGFTSPHGLDQHVRSPVHQTKVYHCPNRLCAREFATLASVASHLESESCGLVKYDEVQTRFKEVITSNRMITFGQTGVLQG